MKISVMQEYIRLAANRNYSKTADELFIAQPVLSRHISSLENELQTKLINRTRNSFELTREGEVVLKEFKRIVSAYENMMRKLSELDADVEGELRLGVLYYDINYYVSAIRDAFRKRFPKVKLILKSYQPEEMEKDLLDGKLDVAIIYGAEGCKVSDIECLPFMQLSYMLIFDRHHRFAEMENIGLKDLNGIVLLRPETPFVINSVSEQLESVFAGADLRLGGSLAVSNYDEVPLIMRETGAVYLSPMANPEAYGNSVEYRLFMPGELNCDLSAVWLKDNENPVISPFCNVLKTCFPE